MLLSRRRKRARKQPSIFRPEDQQGSALVTTDKPQVPRQRKTCLAEASLKTAPSTQVTPLKRKSTSTCAGEQRHRKKLCLGLDLGKESYGNNNISRFLPKGGQYDFSSTSQLVGEDIQCGIISFTFLESDAEGMGENDPRYLGRYADRPGVTKWEPNSKKGRKGSASASNAKQTSSSFSNGALYRSRISYGGNSINLGNHKTSTAAAAAQDLANLALFGSDHRKDRHILSRDEGWNALRTVSMPGARSCGQIDPFCLLLTEQRKAMFEQKIEEALSAIGGRDDFVADILSEVDYGAFKAAEETDEANDAKRLVEAKKAAKEQARKMKKKKARQLEKKNRRQGENVPRVRKRATILPVDRDGFVFRGEHGIYGISEVGNFFFWKRDICCISSPSLQQKPRKDEAISAIEMSVTALPHIDNTGQGKLSPDLQSKKAHGCKGGIDSTLPITGEASMNVDSSLEEILESGNAGDFCGFVDGDSEILPKKGKLAKMVSVDTSETATLPDNAGSLLGVVEKKATSCFSHQSGVNGSKVKPIPDASPSCVLKAGPFSVVSGSADTRKQSYSEVSRRRGKRKSAAKTKIRVVSRISVFQYSSGTESDSLDGGDDQIESVLHSSASQQRSQDRKLSALGCPKKDPNARPDQKDDTKIPSFQIVSNTVVPYSSSMKPGETVTEFGFDSEVVLEMSATSSGTAETMSIVNKLSTHVSLARNSPNGLEMDAAASKSTDATASRAARAMRSGEMTSLAEGNAVHTNQTSCAQHTVLTATTKDRKEKEMKERSSLPGRKILSQRGQDMNENKGFRRRRRCGECTHCLRDDCGKCTNCLDMTKFGGPNLKRQGCKQRKCIFLQIRASAN